MVAQSTTPKSKDRQVRAYEQSGDYLVFPTVDSDATFDVLKRDGKCYVVDPATEACSCPDRRRGVCKHVHLVRFHLDAEAAGRPAPKPVVTAPAPRPSARLEWDAADEFDLSTRARMRVGAGHSL